MSSIVYTWLHCMPIDYALSDLYLIRFGDGVPGRYNVVEAKLKYTRLW